MKNSSFLALDIHLNELFPAFLTYSSMVSALQIDLIIWHLTRLWLLKNSSYPPLFLNCNELFPVFQPSQRCFTIQCRYAVMDLGYIWPSILSSIHLSSLDIWLFLFLISLLKLKHEYYLPRRALYLSWYVWSTYLLCVLGDWLSTYFLKHEDYPPPLFSWCIRTISHS